MRRKRITVNTVAEAHKENLGNNVGRPAEREECGHGLSRHTGQEQHWLYCKGKVAEVSRGNALLNTLLTALESRLRVSDQGASLITAAQSLLLMEVNKSSLFICMRKWLLLSLPRTETGGVGWFVSRIRRHRFENAGR